MKQTVSLVFEALATNGSEWLLVYDNVGGRSGLDDLIPPSGSGHVIITSRNSAEWATQSNAIEVDVFERAESIERLRRDISISNDDADLLAEKMGDLPLALEQAATWCSQTKMPVREYLELFDSHVGDLLSEGRPTAYPVTMYALVKLAVHQLREHAPGAAELLELFGFLGPDPITVALLRSGRDANLSPALRRTLHDQIELNRAIRRVREFGLVKVTGDGGQRLQVHRLVQRILREELISERQQQSRTNAQRILASANPGFPDEVSSWRTYAEMGPHILPAELIDSDSREARAVVNDHVRYLFVRGDYEASRVLGEMAFESWRRDDDSVLGPDHEVTLIAGRHLATALRLLGERDRACELDLKILDYLESDPRFGPTHEHTLYTALNVGVDYRLLGDFQKAYEVDRTNFERHAQVYGADDDSTLRAWSNVAVSLRHLGRSQDSYGIDEAIHKKRRERHGDNNRTTLFSVANLARDLLDLGRYADALELQRKALPLHVALLSPGHGAVLAASSTVAIALRRRGFYAEARDSARENYHDHRASFGDEQVQTLGAALTYANALRACKEYTTARTTVRDTVERYQRGLGPTHPLTLAASIDMAIILRKLDADRRESRSLAEWNHQTCRDVLGEWHPQTLAAASGLANELAMAGESTRACELSTASYEGARDTLGDHHPDTLAAAVNAAIDLQSTGAEEEGLRLLAESRARLREALTSDHPVVLEIGAGERTEWDLDPAPL